MSQAMEMQEFEFEVSRTISVRVRVPATSAEEARDVVERVNFPLPPRDEWTGHKDWEYALVGDDDDGEENEDEDDREG